MKYCSNCDSKISKDSKFCGSCGEEINLVEIETNSCPGCGYVAAEDEKFCLECGTALTLGKNEKRTPKSQAKPVGKKESRPVHKTTTPPVIKKKGSMLRALGKVAIWFFGILIVVTTIFYFMGDAPDTLLEEDRNITENLKVNDFVSVAETIVPEPFDVIKNSISSEGGVISDDEMRLNVPVGALQNNEKIIVKKIQGQLPIGASDRGEALAEAIPISTAYDFGPDGILFQKPVTVTLKYDEKAIPEGMDEKDIVMLYFDGQKWMKVDGRQNEKDNTFSASVNGFPGSLLGLGATLAAVVALGHKLKLHEKLDQMLDDPIKNNWIHKFIEPKNPLVKKYAKKIAIVTENGEKITSFDDPESLAKFFKNNPSSRFNIGFKEKNGNRYSHLRDKYVSDAQLVGSVEDYLNKIERNENKFGDCIEVANTMVSILRSKGYDIKGVAGYMKGKPHAWSEITIGEKVYGIDEYGVITDLEYHKKFVTYPKIGDTYRKEWDEKGTRPYGPTLIIIPPSGDIHVDDNKKHTFRVNTFNFPSDAVFSWNLNNIGRSIKSKKKSISINFPSTGKNSLAVTAYWNGKKLSKTYNFNVLGEVDRKEVIIEASINITYFGRFMYTISKGGEHKESKHFQDGSWVGGVLSNRIIDYNKFSATINKSSGYESSIKETTKIELEFQDISNLESLENFSFDYSSKRKDDKTANKKKASIGKGIPFTVKKKYVKHKDTYAIQFLYKGDIRKYLKKLTYISHGHINQTPFGADPLTIELKSFKNDGEIEIFIWYKKL